MVSASAALTKKKVTNSDGAHGSSESGEPGNHAQSTEQTNSSGGQPVSNDILNESVATARNSSNDPEPHAAPSLSEPGSDGLAPPTTAQPLSNAIVSTKQ